jgi:hypothetical protein
MMAGYHYWSWVNGGLTWNLAYVGRWVIAQDHNGDGLIDNRDLATEPYWEGGEAIAGMYAPQRGATGKPVVTLSTEVFAVLEILAGPNAGKYVLTKWDQE